MKLRTLPLLLLFLWDWRMAQSQQAQGTVPVFKRELGIGCDELKGQPLFQIWQESAGNAA
jgi:hypothetical protein